MSELEAPASVDELYLARGDEVNPNRPLLTGDVFAGINIPGVGHDCEAAIITHPCSMRLGPELAPKLLMALVRPHDPVPLSKWASGFVRLCPLPEFPGGDRAVSLNDVGSVDSAALLTADRLACLTPRGINLLQQRMIYNLTRFSAETSSLHEAAESIFEEADLCEEWADETDETSRVHAWTAFDEWLGLEGRRDRLATAQTRASVRKEMRSLLG